ncbi:hypothetical protein, variant [Fonticula alba]|uniref:Kinetochore protein SPC25 n=1 Tax=Fonticula alba TaxID=691883 RepID=A0A058ZCX9_FONAL|nr:hypothetical protein, variant [Fonticula alba]KCV72239.1 hypothetical protein, variant [Fonticula alba]|eukprot:XP_009493816.1 hypothetical protein, variant [Fonticula alba]
MASSLKRRLSISEGPSGVAGDMLGPGELHRRESLGSPKRLRLSFSQQQREQEQQEQQQQRPMDFDGERSSSFLRSSQPPQPSAGGSSLAKSTDASQASASASASAEDNLVDSLSQESDQLIQEIRSVLAGIQASFDHWVMDVVNGDAAAEARHLDIVSARHAEIESIGSLSEQQSQQLEVYNRAIHQTEGLGERLAELEASRAATTERLGRLEAQVQELQRAIAQEEQDLEAIRAAQRRKEARAGALLDRFSQFLGLRIHKSRSTFSFIFSNIDELDPNREFVVTLALNKGNSLNVLECTPRLPGLEPIMAQLRKDRSLHAFLLRVRREFRGLAGPRA